MHPIALLILVGALFFMIIGALVMVNNYYSLSGIKSRTVGDGQHGTARFATAAEINWSRFSALTRQSMQRVSAKIRPPFS